MRSIDSIGFHREAIGRGSPAALLPPKAAPPPNLGEKRRKRPHRLTMRAKLRCPRDSLPAAMPEHGLKTIFSF